jgi:large subunit ribosomal protein L23
MIAILKRPIVTEKMTALQEKGQYAFEVERTANKIEIAKAVEKKFNVKVVDVRTSVHKGKAKSQMRRRGIFAGRTPSWKKAIVRLKEGDKIQFFENV